MRDKLKAHLPELRKALMRIIIKNPNKIWTPSTLQRELNKNVTSRCTLGNRGAISRILKMSIPYFVVFKNPNPMRYIIFISRPGERWLK